MKSCVGARSHAVAAAVALLLPLLATCGAAPSGSSDEVPAFYIGGIPDQDVSLLNRRFGQVASYLSAETGLRVAYAPSVDYAAVVTAFRRGDLHLAWFGGLTTVQAIAAVPGSEAIAQRPRDADFHSVFIVQSDLPVTSLQDLRGLTFTFGSESSTSGHLMPRHFLLEAGVDPEQDFAQVPNFSGSHDRTIKLVESGAYQAGALNEAVWQSRLDEGEIDTSRVRVLHRTPAYYDYNWTIRAGVDETFGEGTKDRVREALLSMGPEQQEILELFRAEAFIPTRNENYETLREIAERMGIIR